MKTFLLLGAVVAMAGTLWIRDINLHPHRKQIATHQVTAGMTRAEVIQSIGQPLITDPQHDGTELWGYQDGTLVTFSNFGKAFTVDHRDLSQLAAAANARNDAAGSRTWSQLPDGRWIQHDRQVNALNAVGSNNAPPRPAPESNSGIKSQWGWKGSTALDQRPR